MLDLTAATLPTGAAGVAAEADASALDSSVQSAANASASPDVTAAFATATGATSRTTNVAIAALLFGVGRRVRREN
ncbi:MULTISPECIES: hypothetical protein [Haloferax]|uniref:Uncharacterized protein n=4 Tax=Haloferax TaxID=2251 RepID=D4GU36_HALVD|nr:MULTISPECIES: hypothetical protein [Haloferax]ADE04574.1 uncharacterized protein HVO_2023 [Haloferax volcanii DS2]ELK55320.1 hypothetical protein D320_05211 [Haloferax sp. BAB-2207]ELY34538.1 hypothetical protein C498_05401 [Haloferax volcanii DS2]MBC9986729.1 hypothetical protein [Haloferax sp. AS1]MBS8119886.1 hypothetical protein [Haloferax volcanii]